MESFPIEPPAFNGNCRLVESGNTFEWIRQGWALFMVNPAVWALMTLLMMAITISLNFVPFLGGMVANLLMPILAAGMLLACNKAASDETLEVADLFSGFKYNTTNLILLGVIYMVAMLLIMLIVLVIGGGSLLGAMMSGSSMDIGMALSGLLIGVMIALALSVPVMMAMWFAPALVLFNNMAPMDALKTSFNACLKNTIPFLVYGLILLVLCILAALPVMLGFLVLIPVISGSIYASYQDVFVAN